MSAAIEIKNLTKQYQVPFKREAVNAVDNLSIQVEEGEIFGFLGANGAGKTTTIKILLGLIYPTEGEAYVLGKPAGDIEAKQKVAYLPESPYFPEHMTAHEVVTFYAQLFGMKREDARRKAEELVSLVGLSGKSDQNKRIHEFSKGMRQRVGIAQSLINDPKILFYDEPTSGLDAVARRDIRDLMLQLKAQGKTMFLSSHQLEDVERVCHRASIIHKGKLRVQGFVDELLAGERVEITVNGASQRFAERVKTVVPNANIIAGTGTLTVADEPGLVAQVLDLAREENTRIISVIPKRRTLEDLFVEIVGERISREGELDAGAAAMERETRSAAPVAEDSATFTAATTDEEATEDEPEIDPDATVQMRPNRATKNKYKELTKK
ncbi:MAG: ABC transporter ATP-binding protein [Armatimonadaceae bacterium]